MVEGQPTGRTGVALDPATQLQGGGVILLTEEGQRQVEVVVGDAAPAQFGVQPVGQPAEALAQRSRRRERKKQSHPRIAQAGSEAGNPDASGPGLRL